MAIVAGIYATGGEPGDLDALWSALTAGLGAPTVSAAEGRLRAAVFAQHEGDAVTGRDVFPIGFGDPVCPPWLRCRYDAASETATIETDRHGFALVYLRRLEGATAFSTSAAALWRLPPRPARDDAAIAELVAFDHLLGERTLRAGVTAAPQGHDVLLRPGGDTTSRRFRYGDLPLAEARPRAAARALVPVWREGVARVLGLSRGAEVIVPLGGGLASRLLVASATEAGAEVAAFTLGAEGSTDAAIARRVAQALGIAWRALPLEDDWLAAHARRAAALTDGQLDVIHSCGVSVLDRFPPGRLRLDALAGDVVLGGSFLDREKDAATFHARVAALWRTKSRIESPAWQALLAPEARDELVRTAWASLAASLSDGTCDQGDPRWNDFWVLRHRVRRFTLDGSILWAARLRNVFAFFEPRWIEALYAVPPEARKDAAVQAAFLREGWPAMADIPWQRTGPPVRRPGLRGQLGRLRGTPDHPPRGSLFDFDAAFAHSPALRGAIRDALLDPGAGVARFGCFDRGAVERLCDEVAAGRARGMERLGLLFTLVLGEALVNDPILSLR